MSDLAKKTAAIYSADLVRDGMTIGLGSGTTVFFLVQELGARAKQGLRLAVVPTSSQTAKLAEESGLPVSDLDSIDRLSLTIDGADEIQKDGSLIKGGGGALLQEKIVAAASDKLVIIADSSKLVESLGRFPLAVEVIPFGYRQVQNEIISRGCNKVTLRMKNSEVFITDHKHYILDCHYGQIDDPASLNITLHLIPGVVETGIFTGLANLAIIGFDDGRVQELDFS